MVVPSHGIPETHVSDQKRIILAVKVFVPATSGLLLAFDVNAALLGFYPFVFFGTEICSSVCHLLVPLPFSA